MNRWPWVALVTAGLGSAIWGALRLQAWGWLQVPPCPIKAFTGLPCLTCGLTRALAALSQGDLRAAFHWHPVAITFALLLPLLALWDLYRGLQGRDYPALPDRAWARWAVLASLVGTWCWQVARGI